MATNPTPTPTPTPDTGMTFDAAPVTAATPVNTPVSNTPVSTPDTGMTFDTSPTSTAITVAPPNNPLTVDPNASNTFKGSVQQLNSFGAGIGENFLKHLNEIDSMAGIHDKLHDTMEQRQAELAQNNAGNPGWGGAGKLAESGAEFAGGAEVAKAIQGFAMAAMSADGLSGLPASEQFLKVHKTIKAIEDSPLLTRIITSVARGAGVGAAQGGVEANSGSSKASGAVIGALEGGAGGAAEEAVPALVKGAKTAADRIGTVFSGNGAIQDTLQNTIRDAINGAAKDAGVPTSNATSIRDVAQDVSDSMLQSARKDYGALDQATGGRVQRFTDAIKNVQQKLRDIAGLDPDQEGSYIEKLNSAQDAHDAAMKEAEDAGLPKGLINKANASFKQSKAMLDLSKQIQASSEGLRPEMANAAKRPIAETVSTAKLNPRLDKMINSGRIQQAIGPERTTALRQAANDAHADTQTVQNLKATAKKYLPETVLGGAGLYELMHHLTGGSSK